jgi:hypothetical protein
MRKSALSSMAMVLLAAGFLLGATRVFALEDQKMVGTITWIKIAPDEKSAYTTLKSIRGDKEVTLYVTNELVIDKFKNRKLDVGVEVRAKFEVRDAKNHCTYLRKVAGE